MTAHWCRGDERLYGLPGDTLHPAEPCWLFRRGLGGGGASGVGREESEGHIYCMHGKVPDRTSTAWVPDHTYCGPGYQTIPIWPGYQTIPIVAWVPDHTYCGLGTRPYLYGLGTRPYLLWPGYQTIPIVA